MLRKDRTISNTVDDIWTIVEPWLDAERLELDDVEMVGSGKGRTLRIVVDHPDGVDLDRISDVSTGLGRLLDDVPSLQASYQLEVSSPGLERKLRRPAHFHKSIGREVHVKARIDGTTSVAKGELISSDEESIVVLTEDGEVELPHADITSAKTVFRWQAQPKPGKKQGGAS